MLLSVIELMMLQGIENITIIPRIFINVFAEYKIASLTSLIKFNVDSLNFIVWNVWLKVICFMFFLTFKEEK